jgi:hypothetical protein
MRLTAQLAGQKVTFLKRYIMSAARNVIAFRPSATGTCAPVATLLDSGLEAGWQERFLIEQSMRLSVHCDGNNLVPKLEGHSMRVGRAIVLLEAMSTWLAMLRLAAPKFGGHVVTNFQNRLSCH